MSKVLTIEQREQAGSDVYNRFEYQVHWIVCHIINKLHDDTECIVFCEFHDDMLEFSNVSQKYQFFQIKTKEDPSDWTISEMSKREKNKNGDYKKSFLGFVFYNYLTFGAECSRCYFVSNNDFDEQILLWQSYIQDGKKLKTEDFELYQKIRGRIEKEYLKDMPSNFDYVFDDFIQNTFVEKSDLELTTYEDQTKGKFFAHLSDKDIPSNTANLLLQQLINDVRKKSKTKIKLPISKKRLVEEKGIDISKISQKIDNNINSGDSYEAFHDFLRGLSLSNVDIQRLESAKTLHDTNWLNVNDVRYQEIVVLLRKIIFQYCELSDENVFSDELKELCVRELKKKNLFSKSFDMSLIEVLYYEQKVD